MIAPIVRYNITGAIWSRRRKCGGSADLWQAIHDNDRGLAKGMGKDLSLLLCAIAPSYGQKNGGTLLREQQASSMSLENNGYWWVVSDLVEDT